MTRADSSPIGPYTHQPAACRAYDPLSPQVAEQVAECITSRMPDVVVEHVGSSAVPGCAGKGVIDLAVIYPKGRLEAAKAALAELGFQPQTTRDPFPEDRPMRTGSFCCAGQTYRLHAHVIAADSPETGELLLFRNALRNDRRLVEAYVAFKQAILSAGVTDSVAYAIAKGDFVQDFLRRTAGSLRCPAESDHE